MARVVVSKSCPRKMVTVTTIGLSKEESKKLQKRIGRVIRIMNKSAETKTEYFISTNQG